MHASTRVRVPAIHDLQGKSIGAAKRKPHTGQQWVGNDLKRCLGYSRVTKRCLIVHSRYLRAEYHSKSAGYPHPGLQGSSRLQPASTSGFGGFVGFWHQKIMYRPIWRG